MHKLFPVSFFILIAGLLVAAPAHAQTFVSLTHIPGLTESGDLPTLLRNLFLITIGFAAMLGVIMIAVGGVQYMGSDSFSSKGEGRKRIFSAVQGLFIILASYLILNTINPQLLNINIIVPPPTGAGAGSGSSSLILFHFPAGAESDQYLTNICINAKGTKVAVSGGATVCRL